MAPSNSPVDVSAIKRMNAQQLDALFSNGRVRALPTGNSSGTALIFPGTMVEPPAQDLIKALLWDGKVLTTSSDGERGWLVNKLGPGGVVRAVHAEVYKGPSQSDGKPAIVLDYSHTSVVAQAIRDEIREVAPGLFIGNVYWGKHAKPFMRFVLDFNR